MRPRIIALSGPVSAGKSTLAASLAERFGFKLYKSHELIERLVEVPKERGALQKAGELLDRRTKGAWLADALARQPIPEQGVLLDAVRISPQLDALRRAFGPSVTHIHLTAPLQDLSRRYRARQGAVRELATYAQVRANATEKQVDSLQDIADIVVDTARTSPEEVLVRAAAHLGLYGRGFERLVDVLVGGQYGSEGKGHIASFLANEYDVLVRVGGPNAGHKVFELPEPYAFHLLPSGTRRNTTAQIVIGPGAVHDVSQLLKEVAECKVDSKRLAIDPGVMIIEDADRTAERGLVKKIGSTGRGVGQATVRKILRTSAKPPVRLAKDLPELKPFIRETQEVLERSFAAGKRVFLEGTQGTGLSLHHGAYPHVTSRDTTVSGCLAEAGIAPSRVRKIVMVCRTYPIRVQDPKHNTSGPMTREITTATVAKRSGLSRQSIDETEITTTTKRKRRIAEFDWQLLRRAASLNGPTDVALTFADYLSKDNTRARRFEQLTPETIRFIEEVERVAAAPVSLISVRFHFRSIIDRRAW